MEQLLAGKYRGGLKDEAFANGTEQEQETGGIHPTLLKTSLKTSTFIHAGSSTTSKIDSASSLGMYDASNNG